MKPIFRKVVSQCSIEEYNVLLKNLQFIVEIVNSLPTEEEIKERRELWKYDPLTDDPDFK